MIRITGVAITTLVEAITATTKAVLAKIKVDMEDQTTIISKIKEIKVDLEIKEVSENKETINRTMEAIKEIGEIKEVTAIKAALEIKEASDQTTMPIKTMATKITLEDRATPLLVILQSLEFRNEIKSSHRWS